MRIEHDHDIPTVIKDQPSQSATLLSQEANPYNLALTIFEIRVEQLKAYGLLRRESEIRDEWELDDHFDDLARKYKTVCIRLGLAWPPPPVVNDLE